ncbi:MAG: PQQ-binding-like beta-propeller repeat protein [Deltaproteobacteria bacterium]|nr:PQQ-binding-like beta-propeller repeat protein [Deltaproteobacteria bacterium]
MQHINSQFKMAAGILALAAGLGFAAPKDSSAENWPMFLKSQTHSSSIEKAPLPPLTLKWTFKTKGPVYSSPAVYNGTIFIGSHDKNLYAINAATGEALWSFPTEGEILSSPAVSDNMVFFGSKDKKVYALDAQSGKLIWKYETGAGIMTSPVVAEGNVFIASNDLYLYAFNVENGKRAWRMRLPDYEKYSGVYASPAYADGSVFIAGKNGIIYSSSAKSGGRNWSARTESAIYSSPVIREGALYVASLNRTFYAIDVKTGKIIWRKQLDADMIIASPVVTKDSIYVAFKSGHIKSYGRTGGNEIADFKLPSEISSTPVIGGNGIIYCAGEDGFLYALDIKTGAISWKYQTGGGIHSSPAVLEGAVYVGSEDGNVYAFSQGK